MFLRLAIYGFDQFETFTKVFDEEFPSMSPISHFGTPNGRKNISDFVKETSSIFERLQKVI